MIPKKWQALKKLQAGLWSAMPEGLVQLIGWIWFIWANHYNSQTRRKEHFGDDSLQKKYHLMMTLAEVAITSLIVFGSDSLCRTRQVTGQSPLQNSSPCGWSPL